ncbi:MAG: APC family permease [Gemmatimonadaceae bacterium]
MSGAAAAPRQLGVWTASALVVGNIIGAGIFMLPREMARFGWTAVAAWLLAIAGALCMAWVFAQLAAHLPEAGGVHGVMTRGVGPRAAFVGSWGYLISIFAANATLAISGVEYLSRLLPATSPTIRLSIALAALGAVLVANLRGRGGDVQVVSTVVKLLPLIAVIGLTFALVGRDGAAAVTLAEPAPVSGALLLPAMSLILYAMLGVESVAVPAEAIADAQRVVPKTTMYGTALTGVVGILATCGVTFLLPGVGRSDAPLAAFVARGFGGWAGDAVALCAVVSCFGALNGFVLIGGELTASMASQGILPRRFALRNAFGAPTLPHLVGGAVTAVLIVAAFTARSAFAFAALITTATNISLYLLCLAAAVRFLREGRLPRSLSLMGATLGGAIFSLLALYGAGAEALVWGAVLIAAGWPLYQFARRATLQG